MGYLPGERTAHRLGKEVATAVMDRPDDEIRSDANWLTAKVKNPHGDLLVPKGFTVRRLASRLVGRRVVVDVTFTDGSSASIRISVAKAKVLIEALQKAIGVAA